MGEAEAVIARWLTSQLSEVPDNFSALYVEWDNSYLEPNTPREVVFVGLSMFGFDQIKKGNFDCQNRNDVAALGDFIWEGKKWLRLREADYPHIDWTDALKNAAASPEVRKEVRDKNMLLLVGFHDDEVFDMS